MSWTESEKLNEWILRAYENGRQEEKKCIIKLLEVIIEERSALGETQEIVNEIANLNYLIELIEGEPRECECDPCDSKDCSCRGKRCNFCKGRD
jgi:hypothetical protein